MPDGRMVSRSIAHSEQLARVSLAADYLFVRMLPHLDVSGRMPGSALIVKSTAIPLRDDVTLDMVDGLLAELAREGLINWYELDGRRFVEFPGFSRHQRGLRVKREAASRLPSSKCHGAKDIPELLRIAAGPTPGVDPGRLRPDSGKEKLSNNFSSETPERRASAFPAAPGPKLVELTGTQIEQRRRDIRAAIRGEA